MILMVMVMVTIMKMMPTVIYLAEKPASSPRQRPTKDPDKLLSVQEGTLETHRRETKPNEHQIRGELEGHWGTNESQEKTIKFIVSFQVSGYQFAIGK